MSPPILESVVVVPVESAPGAVVAQGPADSTEGQQQANAEEELAAARDQRYVSAFEAFLEDLSEQGNSVEA